MVARQGNDGSRARPRAAQEEAQEEGVLLKEDVKVVEKKAAERLAADHHIPTRETRAGHGGRRGRGGAHRSSAQTRGRRGNGGRHEPEPEPAGTGTAKPSPAARKPKAVFAAPPANAWGRVTETKERLGVASVVEVEADVGVCRRDGATDEATDGAVVVCERACVSGERPTLEDEDEDEGGDEGEEGPGVLVAALAAVEVTQPEASTASDLEAARLAFAALACGVDGLTDEVAVEPVGMENPGNVCFANAVVQALLGCDRFLCLMRRITMAGPVLDASVDEYPVLKAMADIGRELVFRPAAAAGAAEASGTVRGVDLVGEVGLARASQSGSMHQRRRHPRAIRVALITRLVHESFSTRYKGEQRTRQIDQEDAHEFLHCLLDGMHKEFLRLADDGDDGHVDHAGAGSHGVVPSVDAAGLRVGAAVNDDRKNGADGADGTDGADGADGEWLTQSGKRAVKQQVVTTELPTAARRRTVVSELFEGMLATTISSRGNPPSVTMHPFLVVEIPLYDTSIDTLEAAISSVMATETISGYRPAGGLGAACEASKSERFQHLPEVLVLHFMRFQFTGSSEKLNKIVRYGTTLRIKGGWMMAGAKDRRTEYQLVSTVSHHGESISRGHFTANVRHGSDETTCGESDWVNLNDECVRPIREDRVLRDTPYMLFYRRLNP